MRAVVNGVLEHRRHRAAPSGEAALEQTVGRGTRGTAEDPVVAGCGHHTGRNGSGIAVDIEDAEGFVTGFVTATRRSRIRPPDAGVTATIGSGDGARYVAGGRRCAQGSAVRCCGLVRRGIGDREPAERRGDALRFGRRQVRRRDRVCRPALVSQRVAATSSATTSSATTTTALGCAASASTPATSAAPAGVRSAAAGAERQRVRQRRASRERERLHLRPGPSA